MTVQFATIPGRDDRPNEDFAGAFPDCAVLLDGAGGPAEMPSGCIHGTDWFVRQLGARLLCGMQTGRFTGALRLILADAIADVANEHEDVCDLDAPGTPAATVIMTHLGDEGLEYLVLGDSSLVVTDSTGQTATITDRRIDEVAATERKAMEALPTGTPEHQAARIRFVGLQREMRNTPGGYWIASTDPQAAMHAVTGTVASDGLRHVTLLSDGVARFVEFGLGTWAELIQMLDLTGPFGAFRKIRSAERSDPDGVRWPRAKSRDDMAVVHFSCLGLASSGSWPQRDDGWGVPVGLAAVL